LKNEDKTRFKLAMHLFEITFNSEFDNAKLAGYFMALEDLQIEAIETAVKEACKNEKRTPVPATIREYANKYHRAAPQAKISQFSYQDLQPDSELGRLCMANINKLFDEHNPISKREFLMEAQRICDTFNQDSSWINAQWQFQ